MSGLVSRRVPDACLLRWRLRGFSPPWPLRTIDEATVIGLHTHMLLRHYLDEGLSKAHIARTLGIHERTIRRWIASGELDRDLNDAPRYKPRPPKLTKLSPFHALIAERLAAYPRLSAVRLFEEIRAAGYTGGYSQLSAYVARVRPRPQPEPVVRFETPPGHQAQADFAEIRMPWGKRYALLIVLGYSRLLFVRFSARQDMQALFAGLSEAFAYFGGVPREVLFDQMKSVITADLRPVGERLVVNEEFLRFAAHYGFRPRACRPYRAQTKGKVERPVAYLRDNFLYGRAFTGDSDLDEACVRWLEKANDRLHATTHERPHERFLREEQAVLRPLPPRSYHSLLVPEPQPVRAAASTRIEALRVSVEKRPLASYAAFAAAAPAGVR